MTVGAENRHLSMPADAYRDSRNLVQPLPEPFRKRALEHVAMAPWVSAPQ